MNDKIVAEAINVRGFDNSEECDRELILLYKDGTWERIFKTYPGYSTTCINSSRLQGRTRTQVIETVAELCYNGRLNGEFLD